MAVAKVIEITATSEQSFEDAINQGIGKASETVNDIKGAWGASVARCRLECAGWFASGGIRRR